MNASDSPAATAPTDTDRLTELVAAIQRTQRSEDVDGFLDLFAPDAVWVNGAGQRLVGLEEIAAFTRNALPGGMAGQSVRYDVTDVRFPAPDVAITSVDQEYLSADEESFSPRIEGRPTYVWARRDGDWRIVHGQNTGVIPPDDEASAPEDAAALRDIVANVEEGFNRNDVELLVRDIAPDARIVNAVGAQLIGREEIAASTRQGLLQAHLRDATAHYRLDGITLLAPDVAVAHKRAWSTAEAAERGDAPEMTALYVFARRDGRWWIVRRQNTLVAAA
ncbi:SgcJ/EcaC family oxidoreductase [Microbacterium lushaniae]|uniref:SgcJ/EcaC family oxidoreductase n=1 Tax=Microbacterium lushaniae TaxID=2614639 RepID=A0A5J6L6U5_9MICO|nr:SgcJ/EcaC family oxidoreductase [Microbacterium lushaniae]QEW04187.1 SgcJ/EcaC family oxidoreductase [Microbacterium lushaniae]